MTFSWTLHRFSGGALALDVANSVVLRHDGARRIDRFADLAALDGFAQAASELCAERALFGPLHPVATEDRGRFLGLREAIDACFRAQALGDDAVDPLATVLEATAAVLRSHHPVPEKTCLAYATARSALALVSHPQPQRLKICPNCGWLFLDRSRNLSRTWCDMRVCGNRAKASRHYHRKTGDRLP